MSFILGMLTGAFLVRVMYHKLFTGQRQQVIIDIKVNAKQAIKDIKEMETEIIKLRKELNL